MQIIIRKLSYLLLMLLMISIISFAAIHMAPNSFFSAGELNPNMSEETIAQLKAVYGLDKPFLIQYRDWVLNLLTLNFGVSFVSGQGVIDVILQRLPITLLLNGLTLLIVFFLSVYLGIYAALHHKKGADYAIGQLALTSFAMPSFYLALLLMLLFSVRLEWLPIAGLHSVDAKEGFAYYLDMAWHLVLPLSVMIFVSLGSMIVYIRALTLEILKSDYYFFARTRGLQSRMLIRRVILPNLMPPIITLLGLSLPGLIGGSVILEAIFGIEGMGQLFYLSALSRDYPVIMGILMITAMLTLFGNMTADLLLLKLNPYANRE